MEVTHEDHVFQTIGTRSDVIDQEESFPDGNPRGKVAMVTTGLDILVIMDSPNSESSQSATVGRPDSKYCWGARYLAPTDMLSRIVLQRADTGDLEYFNPQ